MTQYGYALVGLTALIAVLVAVLTFRPRFMSALRIRSGTCATAALGARSWLRRCRRDYNQAQERAMTPRGSSERLAENRLEPDRGLLVVSTDGACDPQPPPRLLDSEVNTSTLIRELR